MQKRWKHKIHSWQHKILNYVKNIRPVISTKFKKNMEYSFFLRLVFLKYSLFMLWLHRDHKYLFSAYYTTVLHLLHEKLIKGKGDEAPVETVERDAHISAYFMVTNNCKHFFLCNIFDDPELFHDNWHAKGSSRYLGIFLERLRNTKKTPWGLSVFRPRSEQGISQNPRQKHYRLSTVENTWGWQATAWGITWNYVQLWLHLNPTLSTVLQYLASTLRYLLETSRTRPRVAVAQSG
jgi:hypothetical protein